MTIDYKLIGSRIKDRRKQLGLTQEVMAEKLDVSVGYVSQVERGITKISLDLLARISDILTCDIASLVTGASFGSENYLSDELMRNFAKLDRKNRRLASEFIKLLLVNAEFK